MRFETAITASCSSDGAITYERKGADLKDYVCMSQESAKSYMESCELAKQEARRCPAL